MKFTNTLLKGKLQRRYKRFFTDIEVNNKIVVAHCPNTGSMSGLLDQGNEAWISEHNDPKRKLKFTLEMIKVKKRIIGVNTHRANRIVEHALENKLIKEFAKIKNMMPWRVKVRRRGAGGREQRDHRGGVERAGQHDHQDHGGLPDGHRGAGHHRSQRGHERLHHWRQVPDRHGVGHRRGRDDRVRSLPRGRLRGAPRHHRAGQAGLGRQPRRPLQASQGKDEPRKEGRKMNAQHFCRINIEGRERLSPA